jgi:hypothetical protein
MLRNGNKIKRCVDRDYPGKKYRAEGNRKKDTRKINLVA